MFGFVGAHVTARDRNDEALMEAHLGQARRLGGLRALGLGRDKRHGRPAEITKTSRAGGGRPEWPLMARCSLENDPAGLRFA